MATRRLTQGAGKNASGSEPPSRNSNDSAAAHTKRVRRNTTPSSSRSVSGRAQSTTARSSSCASTIVCESRLMPTLTSSRTFGYARENCVSNKGSRSPMKISGAPKRTLPTTGEERKRRVTACIASRICSAWRRKSSPSSVKVRLRVVRYRSGRPTSSSSRRIWWLIADCVRFRRRAALVKPPASVTATNACRSAGSRFMAWTGMIKCCNE